MIGSDDLTARQDTRKILVKAKSFINIYKTHIPDILTLALLNTN